MTPEQSAQNLAPTATQPDSHNRCQRDRDEAIALAQGANEIVVTPAVS